MPPEIPDYMPDLKALDRERRAAFDGYVGHGAEEAASGPIPPAFTDEALALRFAERHAGDLRYVAAWGKWFHWTGAKWESDDTLLAFDRARGVCREAAAGCNSKAAAGLASAKTVAAVERLAKADRRLAATVDQWDTSTWVLNTPGGVLDLRTAQLRPHRPDDYFTKMTAVSPNGACPVWRAFLDRVTAGDTGLQDFLQRIAGYALTGETSAHALFFFHGVGGNGKSVFLNTLSRILGDYHRTAPIETFTASTGERHPTELAALRGARLVTAIETEEGRRWAESRIKTLTGGDPIAARFMRQDFFEYMPQFKLLIAGNHKPGLRSVDEAIRRRFHLIPFTVTIPPAERDESLPERLVDEWAGILQWAVDGCVGWQERGLAPPACVVDATSSYLEAEDAMAAWLDECCQRDARAEASSAELFESWKSWADRAGEPVGSNRKLSQKLEDRGFAKERSRLGARFIGLRVLKASNWHERAYQDRG